MAIPRPRLKKEPLGDMDMWRSTLMLGTAMALILPEAVAAQTDDSNSTQTEASSTNSGLAEIVVTAQRREESAQRAAWQSTSLAVTI